MKNRITIIAVLLSLMAACMPTNHEYIKKIHTQLPAINEVMVFVEYLDVKDDVKGLWNFDENLNLSKQDELLKIGQQMLDEKGYTVSNKVLLSSGLIIDRNFKVDHIVDKQRQVEPISPPYIVRSIELENQEIRHLEELLAELNRPMSRVVADMRSMVQNTFKTQTDKFKFSKNTGILIIQAYRPRASFFESMGVDIGIATSLHGSGASINLGGNTPSPTTYAYFIHSGTGDLLWSNKIKLITTKNSMNFFKHFPIIPNS